MLKNFTLCEGKCFCWKMLFPLILLRSFSRKTPFQFHFVGKMLLYHLPLHSFTSALPFLALSNTWRWKTWEKIDAESLHAIMQSKFLLQSFVWLWMMWKLSKVPLSLLAFEKSSRDFLPLLLMFFLIWRHCYWILSLTRGFPLILWQAGKLALRWEGEGGYENVWEEKLWIIGTKCPRKSDKLLNNSQSRFVKRDLRLSYASTPPPPFSPPNHTQGKKQT